MIKESGVHRRRIMFSDAVQYYEDCVAAIDLSAQYFMDPMINCNRLPHRGTVIEQNTVVESSGIGVGVVAVLASAYLMLRG
jgi:hypothetical protein